MKACELSLQDGIEKIVEIVNHMRKEKPVILIGIAGGSGSGKGYVAKILSRKLKAEILSLDDYYLGIDKVKDGNFDSPKALDLETLREHLSRLKRGKAVKRPIYDFRIHKRIGFARFEPSKVMILEGLFALHDLLKDELDLKVWVEASEETRLKRRIERDVKERGRTEESVVAQWKTWVQPMFKKFVEPQRKRADIVIINE